MAVEYYRVRCPSRWPHKMMLANKKKVTFEFCGQVFKLFSNPKATFDEIFICPRCHAKWQFTRNSDGSSKLIAVPKNIKLPCKDLPVVVIGEGENNRGKK